MSTSLQKRPSQSMIAIGTGLILLALLTWGDARAMDIRATYGLGADAASYIVALFLAALGVAHLVAAFTSDEVGRLRADWPALLMLCAAIAALILCIYLRAGFVFGTTLLFALTARSFGRRALVMDLGLGLAIGTIIFLLFNKLLRLSLPMGPLERLF